MKALFLFSMLLLLISVYNVFALLKGGGFFLMLPVQKCSLRYLCAAAWLPRLDILNQVQQISVNLMATAAIQCFHS